MDKIVQGLYKYDFEELENGQSSELRVNKDGKLIVSVEKIDSDIESGKTDSGNPVKVGGVYNSSAPTLDSGDRGDLQLDASGNLKGTLATALDKTNDSITNYPAGCNVTTVDLATDADVVVTAAPALLLGVHVIVAMSAHAAIIKDSATAKITLPASTAAGYNIDCQGATFATNITVESDNSGTGTLLIFWRAL
jgi:hypothetical protein